MACRKRLASWSPSSFPKRLRVCCWSPCGATTGSATPLFADSTEENFPCRYGDEVTSKDRSFLLVEGLGSGAFGQVVRCTCRDRAKPGESRRQSPRPVALKILKHKDFCAEVSLEAEEEAKILQELRHPHIVQMLDFFEFQGHLCIALELLGRNLYELISDHQALSIQLVQSCTKQLLLALEYLKQRQVIHGDLKPENVLMVESSWRDAALAFPHFKVIDFGGARRVGDLDDGLVLQTLPYRAPEVLLGLPEVSCAADMWSLGCICIELFVGESLFSHSGDKDQILEGMVEVIGAIPDWMLKQGSRTNEFFDRVKQRRPVARTKRHTPASSRRTPLRRLFDALCFAVRDAVEHLAARAVPGGEEGTEVYKFRRRSTDGRGAAPRSLFGAWRQRRYDLVRRRFGAVRRLAGPYLGRQLFLRRHMEKLIRRMLVLDPLRRSDASECLRLISSW